MGGISSMTAQQAYWKAKGGGWTQELEDIVVNSEDPEYAYYFACDIYGANIPKLEQVVIDSGDPDWAHEFARYVKGANISDLIDFVLINEPELIKKLFGERPDLKRKYELGEIRKQIRGILR